MTPDASGGARALITPLTAREHDILRLMADDLAIQAVAERLHLSPTTVKWYTQQIYGKLGIEGQGQKRRLAVARARTLGLLEAERTPAGRLRYNLPVQTTPLVGRARELHDLTELLANPAIRLVTLLGPGGIGKTRLALEVAWRLVEPEAYGARSIDVLNGVYFTPLQPLDAGEAMLWAIAEAVGYRFQVDGREPLRQLMDFFREKRLLLVLDNFEHLLDGAALVSDLLQAAPGVQVLATSRETLNLLAEAVYPVTGLPFTTSVAPAPDYDAARLFVQGARRARASFTLQPDDWQPLARICALVDGMPLALLLAAAWVEVLFVHEIADEIARSIDFLAAETRDAPPRQWSIRAVFEPTWARLSAQEQAVFMRLSVFHGGCTRHAAQAVTDASLPVLQGLVNKAVLTRTPQGRYEIHALLSQYAYERLAAAGDAATARDAHCAYYAEFMHARQEDLKGGDRQPAALDEIEAEFENVRAAWEWAIERRQTDALLRLEWPLWYFLYLRWRLAEGCNLFRAALECDEDPLLRGWILAHCANFHSDSLRFQEADEWYIESIAIARNTGAQTLLACVLTLRALDLAGNYSDFAQADRLSEEGLRLYEALGDTWGILFAENAIALGASLRADFRSVQAIGEKTLALARQCGDRRHIAMALSGIGVSHLSAGDYDQAQPYLEESLAVQREINDSFGMAVTLGNLAENAMSVGDFSRALEWSRESTDILGELGSHVRSTNLVIMAHILALAGRFDEIDPILVELSRMPRGPGDHFDLWRQRIWEAGAAYARRDFAASLRLAHDALEIAKEHAVDAWATASSLWIGLSELKLGQFEAAREHVRRYGQGETYEFLIPKAVFGMAELARAEDQPVRAVELATLALHHKRTDYEFKVYATELLAALESALAPEAYAAAVERGATLNSEAVIAAWAYEREA